MRPKSSYTPPFQFNITDTVRHKIHGREYTVTGMEHTVSPKNYAYNLVYVSSKIHGDHSFYEWELHQPKLTRKSKIKK